MSATNLAFDLPPRTTVAPDGGGLGEAARVRLGANLTTSAEILLRLALDPSVTVRAALALNPSAPPAALGVLARDADDRVRALLARKLAALAPCLTEIEQSRLNQETVAALAHLVADTAVRVRAAIAEVVKDMPNAPRALVLCLARDTAIEVSEPVIRLSPLLTQDDLLALVAGNAPAVALAIARRPELTEDVVDAIAATTDDGAIQAMLLNHSAQIRESTLDALIARAADHIGWHAPLVRRPNLSPRAAEALSRIVADTLLGELARRADLPEAVTVELHARLAARLLLPAARRSLPAAVQGLAGTLAGAPTWSDAANPADTSCPTDVRSPTGGAAWTGDRAWTGALAGTDDPMPTSALSDAHALAVAGRLTETELLRLAARGEAHLIAAMLAVAADVPLALVERVATLRSAKGVVSLIWKAGFSMRLATPLQILLARLGPGTLLAPGPGGGFPLAVEEMRWQLEFLGRAAPANVPPTAPPAGPVSAP
jgi:Uncharacterised protein conserved in bacteria (DUF2336)/Leucine rich repeat variant